MQEKIYKIVYKKSALKDLKKIPQDIRVQLLKKISNLAIDPYPQGSSKMRGFVDMYRVRHGDYRVIYLERDDELVILILKIGHRQGVYSK